MIQNRPDRHVRCESRFKKDCDKSKVKKRWCLSKELDSIAGDLYSHLRTNVHKLAIDILRD